MIILADEEAGVWSRLDDFIERNTKKIPKTGKGIKKYLIGILTLIFGEDCIIKDSAEIFPTSVNIRVEYTIRVSPNGMRQVATGTNLLQNISRVVTLIYYDDIEEHHLVTSEVQTIK